jgi:ribosomal protein L44E
MKLSEVNVTPLYPITIPSTKKKAKYRPFLVKEERALLAAQESENLGVMLETLRQVVTSCVEPSSAVESMTTFDLEYIYTLIRCKSVGEFSDLIFRCDTCDDENAKAKVSLDLRKVEVVFPEDVSNKIKLSDRIVVMMKYPSMEELAAIEGSEENDAKDEAIKSCIESIYVEDTVYHVKEERPEELNQFIESLTSRQFKMLEDFFDNIPTAQIPVKYTCPVCHKEHNKIVKGLNNFFY